MWTSITDGRMNDTATVHEALGHTWTGPVKDPRIEVMVVPLAQWREVRRKAKDFPYTNQRTGATIWDL